MWVGGLWLNAICMVELCMYGGRMYDKWVGKGGGEGAMDGWMANVYAAVAHVETWKHMLYWVRWAMCDVC